MAYASPASLGEIMQARGITMKSSSICLLHIPGAASRPGGPGTASAEDKLNKGVHIPLPALSHASGTCNRALGAQHAHMAGIAVTVNPRCFGAASTLRSSW